MNSAASPIQENENDLDRQVVGHVSWPASLTVAWMVGLLTLWLPVVVWGRSTVVSGIRYWWLVDDPMISMRYAHNLARGWGLVWNPGEHVEGYSNLLWVLWMAIVHRAGVPVQETSLVILLSNLGLGLAGIPLTVRLARLLGSSTRVIAACVIAYCVNDDVASWALDGYETTLLMVLVLFSLVRLLEERDGVPRSLTYVSIASVSLVRADAAILSAMLYCLAVWLQHDRRRALGFVVSSASLAVASEIFRLWYYHQLLPNTAYLKTTGWPGRTTAGLEYVGGFTVHYCLLLFGMFVLVARKRGSVSGVLGAGILAYTIYVAYVGGDAFEGYGFFAPLLPVAFVLGLQGLSSLRLPRRIQIGVIGLCIVSMPNSLLAYQTMLSPDAPNSYAIGNLKMGLLLKQDTPESTRVADGWAGAVFYFSDRYAIDWLGLNDSHIAHEPVASNGMLPGHNKFDFTWSIGSRRPDLILSNFKLPVTRREMTAESVGNVAFTGRLYFNKSFRSHCLAYPIAASTWRSIFECRWPGRESLPLRWRRLQ